MCESVTELGPQVCDRKEVRSVLKEKDYHNAIQRFQQTLRTFSGLQKYAHPLAWLTWVEKPPDESKPKTTSLLDSHNFAFNNEYFFQFIKFFDHQRRIQSCSICMAMLSQILTWLKRKKRGQTWNGTLHNTWEDYQELLQPSGFSYSPVWQVSKKNSSSADLLPSQTSEDKHANMTKQDRVK